MVNKGQHCEYLCCWRSVCLVWDYFSNINNIWVEDVNGWRIYMDKMQEGVITPWIFEKKDGRANCLAILLCFYENGQILLIQLIMILSIGQSLISQLLLPSAKANIHKNIKFDVAFLHQLLFPCLVGIVLLGLLKNMHFWTCFLMVLNAYLLN